MPKKYKLITPCAEYPLGTEARQENSKRGYYEIWVPGGDSWENVVRPIQIENNPVWQLIPEVPEKKIVERWRGNEGEYYFTISTTRETEQNRFIDEALYCTGDYFQAPKVCTRANQRVEIMCRLMGLAETIEEGSTEMRKGWIMSYSQHVGMWRCLYKDEIVPTIYLATFSTEKLAQLFLDSAGQDAIDWYGAVK